MNELMRLDELTDSSREEKELAELLTVLIDELEARDLTQKDLWKVFGSRGVTFEVFHGERAIQPDASEKVGRFFSPRSGAIYLGDLRRHRALRMQ